jgi:integrase
MTRLLRLIRLARPAGRSASRQIIQRSRIGSTQPRVNHGHALVCPRLQSAGIGWSAATAAAGLAGFRVHDLRHTAASVWLGAGADPKVVQRVLGHATAFMTMDLYGNPRELHQTGAFALVAW